MELSNRVRRGTDEKARRLVAPRARDETPARERRVEVTASAKVVETFDDDSGSVDEDEGPPACVEGRLPPIPGKRCAYCNTMDTPLWRHGPFGPKTLCNACGVRDNRRKQGRLAAQRNKVRKGSTNRRPSFSGQGSALPATDSAPGSPTSFANPHHRAQPIYKPRGMVRVASVRSLRSCNVGMGDDDFSIDRYDDDYSAEYCDDAADVEAAVAAIEGHAGPIEERSDADGEGSWLAEGASGGSADQPTQVDTTSAGDSDLTPMQMERLVHLFDLTGGTWGDNGESLLPGLPLKPLALARKRSAPAPPIAELEPYCAAADSDDEREGSTNQFLSLSRSDSPVAAHAASDVCDNQLWAAALELQLAMVVKPAPRPCAAPPAKRARAEPACAAAATPAAGELLTLDDLVLPPLGDGADDPFGAEPFSHCFSKQGGSEAVCAKAEAVPEAPLALPPSGSSGVWSSGHAFAAPPRKPRTPRPRLPGSAAAAAAAREAATVAAEELATF